jgi:site-specific recombinase XerD
MKPPVLIASSPKGRNQRALPLHPEAWQALRAYGLPRSGLVFRNDIGRPLAAWMVTHRVSLHLHGLGIDASAHSLRHWFASTLYSNTLDLRVVQQMLGHANPATTAIYAAFDPGAAVADVTALKPAVVKEVGNEEAMTSDEPAERPDDGRAQLP